MKIKFKSLSITLMIVFLLTTISCQVEESAITESKNQELLIKKIDSKKVFENKKVAQKINSLKQNTENLKTGRIIYDSTFDFFIDTDNVVYADNGSVQTYTFPISRTVNTNNLENIVIKIENDSINTFLLNYNKSYNDVTNQQSGLEQVTCQAIDFNSNNVIASRVATNEFCFDVYVWDVLPNHQGDLVVDTELYVYGWVFQGSNCFTFGGGGSGTSSGNYGNTSNTGGNLGSSPGTGSGGGSNNTGAITVPIEFNPLSTREVKAFVNQLNPDQLAWWNDEDNEDAVESFAIYLSQADANEYLIEMLINNNINGAPIVLGPDIKIDNINTFLNCLNTSQPAVLTVYCMQPVANSPVANDHTFVGHTFISITQGTHKKVIGFYPVSNYIMPGNETGQGVLGNDTNQPYNVRVTTSISPTQLQAIKNYIINHASSTYNLDTYNCTDFAIEIGNLGGLSLPDSYGTWTGGGGSNPGALGQHIRGMSGPGISTNSTLGSNYFNAPLSTKCN